METESDSGKPRMDQRESSDSKLSPHLPLLEKF